MPSLEPVYIVPHNDPTLVPIRAHSQTGKGVGELRLDFFFFCKTPFNANYTLILLIMESFFFGWAWSSLLCAGFFL